MLLEKLRNLQNEIDGDLHFDKLMRALYATDASVYRELPTAVALPKHTEDIQKIVDFAAKNQLSVIPRAAGTSLAGQCVGEGIVMDVSKYMNKILEINAEEGWVRVQPGVIRDELNAHLEEHGWWFGPNTSTANRAMIGGMVGNNSCGSTSIKYGTTRDHVLELKVVLSDSSEVVFQAFPKEEFERKLKGNGLENKLYQQLHESLSDKKQQKEIRKHYPKSSIHRRNTGYAVDAVLESNIFTEKGDDFNFCKLLCGSEGTLAFTTEIKLQLDPLPPKEEVLVAAHFMSIDDAMKATVIAMQHEPYACELMDKIILDCTKDNLEQQKNRFFLVEDPAAVLLIELRAEKWETIETQADKLIRQLQDADLGYAFPKIYPPKTDNIWNLRKAGLGVLSNIEGDRKPVACIEDTAVDVADLPAYIQEFSAMMHDFGQKAVYYAHAGAGELHLRPILDLKDEKDVQLFHEIGAASAKLVKKYNGSLSGEHGDGRVRAEFIPLMIGEKNYKLLKQIKETWDPLHIFNPGKIVEAPPMTESLRYEPGQSTPDFNTVFDFSKTKGILRAAEKCNGSGDCRKLPFSGGTMCPSYQATRDEKDTTRARANALREFLTQHADAENPFNQQELYEVMDLCISCKGCTSECPSNVDMSTMKAEFLHQYYQSNKIPLRVKAFANIATLNSLGTILPGMSNFFLQHKTLSKPLKKMLGIAPKRQLPPLAKQNLRRWYKKNKSDLRPQDPLKGKVYLFADEFTNYNDVAIGQKAIKLLTRLGYQVELPTHAESGRAHISKGLLIEAQQLARRNVEAFGHFISEETPLIGIEPSAILSFRDEYPRLVPENLKETATELAQQTFLIDEFLAKEIQKGNITPEQFTTEYQQVLLHGHCHQKALSSVSDSAWLLGLPKNYTVEVIPSGCCGMAGSFGYEAEHYDVSMQIGELVLFPAVRKAEEHAIIAAPGTSCRHQIFDGTGRTAQHPVEVLYEALLEE